jgi:hypothetical protein
MNVLRIRYGLSPSISNHDGYFRIYISTIDMPKLINIVRPYMPASMI